MICRYLIFLFALSLSCACPPHKTKLTFRFPAPAEFPDTTTQFDTVYVINPERIKLAPGPSLIFDSSSIDTTLVEIKKGYILGYSSVGIGGMVTIASMGRHEHDSLPLVINPRGLDSQNFRLPKRMIFLNGVADLSMKFEFFQTTLPEQEMWMPESREGFESLWKKEWTVSFTKKEFEMFQIPDSEIYNSVSINVPQRLQLKSGKKIWVDKNDFATRQVKIKKGNMILTIIRADEMQPQKIVGSVKEGFFKLPKNLDKNRTTLVSVELIQEDSVFAGCRFISDANRNNLLWQGNFTFHGKQRISPLVSEVKQYLLPEWETFRVPLPASFRYSGGIIDVAPETDTIWLETNKQNENHTLIRFIVYNDTMRFVDSVPFDSISCRPDSSYRDSIILGRLQLVETEFPALDSCRFCLPNPFWTKEYEIPVN